MQGWSSMLVLPEKDQLMGDWVQRWPSMLACLTDHKEREDAALG